MKPFLFFLAVILSLGIALPARANPQVFSVSCNDPTHQENHLVRPYGDSNGWAFEIQLTDGAHWVPGHEAEWTHSGDKNGDNNADPKWGQWQGGTKGASSITWSQPDKTGAFYVSVTGWITCGTGGGGGHIVINVDWFGNVKNKDWDPGTAIGKKPQPDGTTTEDGRIISPQDWRVDPPNPPVVIVEPGESVTFQVEKATDFDHWEKGDKEDTEPDTPLSYTWDAGDNGVFDPTDGIGQTVTWKAPDKGGTYPIHCTIDDEPMPIDTDNGEEGDRDDAKLIRQMQIKVAKYKITFDGTPKACAEGVDDSVHKFPLTATVTREGMDMPNHAITLFFEGNDSNGKKASFATASQDNSDDPTDQIHLTTDPDGKVRFTVISGDLITNSITIKAKSTTADGHEITLDGEETCNFGEAESERGFQLNSEISSFPNDPDNGWWFNPDVLINSGGMTTAKIYLKYEDADGQKVPVNGHKLKVWIGDVTTKSAYTRVDEEGLYAYFVDKDGMPIMKNGQPQGYVIATTGTSDLNANGTIEDNEKGFATIYMKGGPLIYQAKTIPLKAEDQTQVQ